MINSILLAAFFKQFQNEGTILTGTEARVWGRGLACLLSQSTGSCRALLLHKRNILADQNSFFREGRQCLMVAKGNQDKGMYLRRNQAWNAAIGL